MFQSAINRNQGFYGLVLAVVSALASPYFAVPALSETKSAPNAVTLLIGRGTDTDYTQILTQPWTVNFVDLTMVGGAASTRLGTINELIGSPALGSFGDDLSIELEAGAAYRFGEESQGEFWGTVYFRYDGLPWNDTIYTTIAVNTGVSLLTETSEFERGRSDGQTSRLLNYLAPEITFADPDNKDLELVLRLHHRSGVFGTFDGVTGGSTFVSTGIRVRF